MKNEIIKRTVHGRIEQVNSLDGKTISGYNVDRLTASGSYKFWKSAYKLETAEKHLQELTNKKSQEVPG